MGWGLEQVEVVLVIHQAGVLEPAENKNNTAAHTPLRRVRCLVYTLQNFLQLQQGLEGVSIVEAFQSRMILTVELSITAQET
jgi:hypothetical protein